MKVWRLKKDHDRRIRQFHPWVFSNELADSPKGVTPGESIELRDFKDQFLARGYGNFHSLIAFRALSFDPMVLDPSTEDEVVKKLVEAFAMRVKLGYTKSMRLCFSETDELPGLIIDYYLLKGAKPAHAFVIQLSTAGMQRIFTNAARIIEKLVVKLTAEKLTSVTWDQTEIVLRNDLVVRKLEGLAYEQPLILKNVDGINLAKTEIILKASAGTKESDTIAMTVDLVEGQKTGFFLDQVQNIDLVVHHLEKWILNNFEVLQKQEFIRILDLCCYVGHWSAQLSYLIKKHGLKAEVTVVDVSQEALDMAKANAEKEGALVISKKMDVLEHLPNLNSRSYDIVIADPPAFIKNKKDIPTGKHAYFKINQQAFRLCTETGFVVSCSCSGLLTEDDFRDSLKKAQSRSMRKVFTIARGGPAVDHPLVHQFTEGHYLKMFLHFVAG